MAREGKTRKLPPIRRGLNTLGRATLTNKPVLTMGRAIPLSINVGLWRFHRQSDRSPLTTLLRPPSSRLGGPCWERASAAGGDLANPSDFPCGFFGHGSRLQVSNSRAGYAILPTVHDPRFDRNAGVRREACARTHVIFRLSTHVFHRFAVIGEVRGKHKSKHSR